MKCVADTGCGTWVTKVIKQKNRKANLKALSKAVEHVYCNTVTSN